MRGGGKKLCVRDGWAYVHVHDFYRQSTGLLINKVRKMCLFFSVHGCIHVYKRKSSYARGIVLTGARQMWYVCAKSKRIHRSRIGLTYAWPSLSWREQGCDSRHKHNVEDCEHKKGTHDISDKSLFNFRLRA